MGVFGIDSLRPLIVTIPDSLLPCFWMVLNSLTRSEKKDLNSITDVVVNISDSLRELFLKGSKSLSPCLLNVPVSLIGEWSIQFG